MLGVHTLLLSGSDGLIWPGYMRLYKGGLIRELGPFSNAGNVELLPRVNWDEIQSEDLRRYELKEYQSR